MNALFLIFSANEKNIILNELEQVLTFWWMVGIEDIYIEKNGIYSEKSEENSDHGVWFSYLHLNLIESGVFLGCREG